MAGHARDLRADDDAVWRNFAVAPLPGHAQAIPKPISRAILNIVGATAISSSASPRLIASVRSSALCRPGFSPATISPRSAYGVGRVLEVAHRMVVLELGVVIRADAIHLRQASGVQ